MKKIIITIVVLSVLLLGTIGYIGYDFYSDAKVQEQMEIYQAGAQIGYEQAISQIIQIASSCQQVPLRMNNQTINIVSVECLQQQSEE